MSELPESIQDLLARFGITEESAHKFRFGGVVGKIAIIGLAGFLAVIGVAKYASGYIQLVCILAILGTVVLITRWILTYAEKHPISATLEGAEIILWRQQQIMLAAKNTQSPKQSPVIPNPEGTAPQLSPPEGADE